jgi:Leucine-rich repeat (LRR) protein
MASRLTVVLLSLLLATPVLIFWLGLVIVPARVATLCPEECSCDPAGHHITCYDRSLTAVPLIRHVYVRYLDISINNIRLFKNDSFISLTELEILIASSCGLRTIQLGTFNGLTKLRELILSNNVISEIIPGTFEDMNSLEYLYLGYNSLEKLDSDVFSGLFKLEYLHLGGNSLRYLHPDTFLGLPNLQELCLNNNPGLQIPTDSPFIKSPSLSYLHILRNSISSLSVETFANVSVLEWLDLGYNNLTTVDINILMALPKLSVW